MEDNLIIGTSGIRGIVFDPLSPEVCCRYSSAFASTLGRGKYVVGRDSRPSGAVLKLAALSGIVATGASAVDVGICPTPTIQIAVEHHDATGGIAVTASHNPAQWNALKLISKSGTFLGKEEISRVIEAYRSGSIKYATFEHGLEILDDTEACERHVANILELDCLDLSRIRKRGFKVAIDCTNGAGSVIGPAFLRRIGCDVVEVDCERTGVFNRNPEPLAGNISHLCQVVRDTDRDLGFAFDPDGDRLAVVDESGSPLGEEYTLVICTDLVLRRSKGPVVANLSTTMAVGEVARRYGVEFHRAPIGEINVVERMKAVASPIGGEGNGGVILPAIHYGRDALVAMALVLEALAESGEPLSQMMKRFPRFDIIKEKISLDSTTDFHLISASLEKEFSGADFNFDDGIRIELGDRWLHVRKSGTEPVIRLISEAAEPKRARDLINRALGALPNRGGM